MLDDIGSALWDGLGLVFTFVPELMLFLVILLVGWLIAQALRRGVNATRTDELPLHRDGNGADAPGGGPTHAR